jgi:hypothetical protein
VAALQGGALVVHFTNRKNAPLLFSTGLGTRPRRVGRRELRHYGDLDRRLCAALSASHALHRAGLHRDELQLIVQRLDPQLDDALLSLQRFAASARTRSGHVRCPPEAGIKSNRVHRAATLARRAQWELTHFGVNRITV